MISALYNILIHRGCDTPCSYENVYLCQVIIPSTLRVQAPRIVLFKVTAVELECRKRFQYKKKHLIMLCN